MLFYGIFYDVKIASPDVHRDKAGTPDLQPTVHCTFMQFASLLHETTFDEVNKAGYTKRDPEPGISFLYNNSMIIILNRVNDFLNLKKVHIDIAVHLNYFNKWYMHDAVVFQSNHNAFLVVEQSFNSSNPHLGGSNPIGG